MPIHYYLMESVNPTAPAESSLGMLLPPPPPLMIKPPELVLDPTTKLLMESKPATHCTPCQET